VNKSLSFSFCSAKLHFDIICIAKTKLLITAGIVIDINASNFQLTAKKGAMSNC
jgi:hypothetical protein